MAQKKIKKNKKTQTKQKQTNNNKTPEMTLTFVSAFPPFEMHGNQRARFHNYWTESETLVYVTLCRVPE